MTRKDYELLARVFAATKPLEGQFTKTSPSAQAADGLDTMFDGISYKAAYGAWEKTIRELCDALENENPRFNRAIFQYAATAPIVITTRKGSTK